MRYSQKKTKLVVLDTNVLVSAILTQNSIPSVVFDIVIREHTLITSKEALFELKNTLKRKKFDKYVPLKIRIGFIKKIENNSKVVKLNNIPDICRDADDNILLATADIGDADYLVTGDNDLLVLENYNLVRILTPKEFLYHIQ